MRADAEQATGPVWAEEDDPRITRLGKSLRRFRLDELPQLFNVVRGEMSLVGPRPERPHFVKMLNGCVPYYGLRHCVKPGVTGWAQVLYPYGASVQDAYEKMQYDLYYAKHMSLGFDLRILASTVRVVAFGRGR
jgi:lipopolysaccharide/colanic/teichoic acid biosynthesis glycosyltransferase